MDKASSKLTICEASFSAERFSRAEGGQVERDMPGMSNIVTVKVEARREATVVKLPQSPSPEGMKRRSGPLPWRSVYHEMPSLDSICFTVGVVIFGGE